MSFDWKKTVGALAPTIATAFGTPVAGVAVSALLSAFGIDSSSPDAEKQLSDKVQAMTANDLLLLKQTESKFILDMKQLDIDVIKLGVEDKDSARKREIGTNDSSTPRWLAVFAVGCFIGLIFSVIHGVDVATGMKDTFLILVGAAIAMVKDVYGYYFGSSSGSKEKDNTITSLSK